MIDPFPQQIFARRSYFHFDEPVSPDITRSIATNPLRVAKWAFMPMLHCKISTRKVKRRTDGSLEKKSKIRPIEYAAHKDAAIYATYGFILSRKYEEELYERGLQDVVTAFRRFSQRCNIDYAKESFDWITQKGRCTALAFDIENFFGNLDHHILKTLWEQVLNEGRLPDDHYAVYRSLTRYSHVDRSDVFKKFGISESNPRAGGRRRICTPFEFRSKVRGEGLIQVNDTQKGIPQGSPMSAVLSNIYMLDFDSDVSERVTQAGGIYRRYCDDMLCIVPNEHAAALEEYVINRIAHYKLTIQEAKTKRHVFSEENGRLVTSEPLQYLGFTFDGVRTLIRTASIAKYYRKMRAGVNLAKQTRDRQNKLRATHGEPVEHQIYRRKLNITYSYIGRHNFISYALKSANKMQSNSIRKQIRRHWRKLNQHISKEELWLQASILHSTRL